MAILKKKYRLNKNKKNEIQDNEIQENEIKKNKIQENYVSVNKTFWSPSFIVNITCILIIILWLFMITNLHQEGRFPFNKNSQKTIPTNETDSSKK
ncbi:hypothetical protein [Candidatus Phytoplasma pyri]|uniref:hypothetical protein n=1 Tax=Candidatus Phytoplasma pyri TaxID=47566 RepID=UPI003982E418